jgi:hypothetical protein
MHTLDVMWHGVVLQIFKHSEWIKCFHLQGKWKQYAPLKIQQIYKIKDAIRSFWIIFLFNDNSIYWLLHVVPFELHTTIPATAPMLEAVFMSFVCNSKIVDCSCSYIMLMSWNLPFSANLNFRKRKKVTWCQIWQLEGAVLWCRNQSPVCQFPGHFHFTSSHGCHRRNA